MALTDDLVFSLNQDGNALDSSGNGFDGVETGVTYSSDQTKIFAKSALYDGTDDNIVIPKAGLPSTLSALTLTSWVYFNAIDKTQFIFMREDIKLYLAVDSTNHIVFRHADIGDGATFSSSTVSAGTWIPVGITWDGSDTAIYIGGSDTGDGEAATGTISFAETEDVYLGESQAGANDLDAYMVQTSHWSRALSPAEMSILAAGVDFTKGRQRFIGKRPILTVDKQIIGNRGNPIIR